MTALVGVTIVAMMIPIVNGGPPSGSAVATGRRPAPGAGGRGLAAWAAEAVARASASRARTIRSVFRVMGRTRSDVSRRGRSEEHTSELQSLRHLVCRLLLEKKN